MPNIHRFGCLSFSHTQHVGDECFVHYLEVVLSSEVLTCIQLLAGGTQFVHCREVVRSSECPLLEVSLYHKTILVSPSNKHTNQSDSCIIIPKLIKIMTVSSK